MPRGLDHVVHVVRDLDMAGEVYDLLGFSVGARNRHPWGTQNRIVQAHGFFIELLEVSEPDLVPEPDESHFSFGAFNRDFLARNGQGLSMLAFESLDPAADKAQFDAAGLGGFEVSDFSRKPRRPEGAEAEVSFSLAFARDPAVPDVGFFSSLQHKPENFWNPDLQRHANGVTELSSVIAVAERPADHVALFEVLAGVTAMRAVDGWYIASTPRGRIEIMTRALFEQRYGGPAPAGTGLRLAALCFCVPGITSMRRGLAARRMIEEKIQGLIVVPPSACMGATLAFDRTE